MSNAPKSVIESVWRRLRRPSPATLAAIEAAGAKVERNNFWPDYKPIDKKEKRAAAPTAIQPILANTGRNRQ